MIDELFDRNYQSGRTDLNAAVQLLLNRAGRAALNAFEVLARIEYNAPWLERRRTARRA
ncbi:MAG TPA: hypothetical protein VFP53_02495 [Sphingomicrobium sp.]|nr:hypothetical protein [Sphingomicrobium sp.]